MSLLYKMDKHLLVKLIENIEDYDTMSIDELLTKRNKIEDVLNRKIKEKRVKYVKNKLLSILRLPNFSFYHSLDISKESFINFIENITDISVDSHTIYFSSDDFSNKRDKNKEESKHKVFFKHLAYSSPNFFTFLKEEIICPVRVYFHIWYCINEYILKEVEVGWFCYDYTEDHFLIDKRNGRKYILNDHNQVELYFA